MPILNLLPRENMLFGTEGIELYKDGNYIDSHGAYPNGTSYDFTTRISFNASTGRITFQYHDDVSGGATIEKGGLVVNSGNIAVKSGEIYIDNAHSKGICLRENDTTYAGEGIWIGGYFSGTGDSNYLRIMGSATNTSTASWANIMTLTASSGNLWIKGTGSFGGNLSVSGSATISSTLTVNNTTYITGQLQLDNSSMDRTTSPSSTQYHGIFYRDKNDRRLVNLEYARSTNGTAQLNLYVLQPNTTTDSYSGIIIYRQTDGKTYATVGNSSISGTILRNIQCRNSSSSNVATQYLITNRL